MTAAKKLDAAIDLTPEELDELERRLADADAHPERLIPLEKFLTDRGMVTPRDRTRP